MVLWLILGLVGADKGLSVQDVSFNAQLDKKIAVNGLEAIRYTFKKRIHLVEEASKCVDCIFFKCHSQLSWGGAIHAAVPFFLRNCFFDACTSESCGGALSCGSSLTASGCTFRECSADEYGVLVSHGSGQVKCSIELSYMVSSSAVGTGTYLVSNHMGIRMNFVNLSDSRAQDGGAFGEIVETSSIFGYCKLTNGTVDRNWPCLRLTDASSVDLKSCIFQGFRSLEKCTGKIIVNVIHLYKIKSAVLDTCYFLNNGISSDICQQVECSGRAVLRMCCFDKPISKCFQNRAEMTIDEVIFESTKIGHLSFPRHIGFMRFETSPNSPEILQLNRVTALILSLVAFAAGWGGVKLQARMNRPFNKQGNFQRLD